jgi:hypothetical protein
MCLAACGAGRRTEPDAHVNIWQERARHEFDTEQTTWDTFSLGGDQAVFRVEGGALEGAVIADRGYIWSLEGTRSSNTAVTAIVRQSQGSRGNGFGLMCRADEGGNGYYFLISSAGQFAILKATAETDDPARLVDWQSSSAVRPGDEANTIQAVCAGDYLSFFANGQFVADVNDPTFSAGEVGVGLGAVEETLWVRFDDIVIRDAALVG